MVFPSEAAFLDAVLILVDVGGWDDEYEEPRDIGGLVRLLGQPPYEEETSTHRRLLEQLQAQSEQRNTTHPAWDPTVMPLTEPLEVAPSKLGPAVLGLQPADSNPNPRP